VCRRGLSWIIVFVFASSTLGCARCSVREKEAPAADVSVLDALDATDELAVSLEPLPPDAPFQGIVTLEARAGHGTPPAKYVFTLKGKKARWDLLSPGEKGQVLGFRVYDGDQHAFFTVAPARKSVFVTSESALLKGDAAPPSRAWTWNALAVEPHGALLGYSCDRETTRDEEFEYDVCASDKLVSFPMQELAGPLTSVVPFNGSLGEKGLFPLFVTVRRLKPAPGQAPGATAGNLRVLHVDRGKVSDSAFELPPWPRVDAVTLDYGRPAQK
jgi:hypothetical protein